jgi:hypothetical protein
MDRWLHLFYVWNCTPHRGTEILTKCHSSEAAAIWCDSTQQLLISWLPFNQPRNSVFYKSKHSLLFRRAYDCFLHNARWIPFTPPYSSLWCISNLPFTVPLGLPPSDSPFRFHDYNFVHIYNFYHMCYMYFPSHRPWPDHPNNIRWRVIIRKLLIMQFFPSSPISLNAIVSTRFSKAISPCLSLNVRDQGKRFCTER